MNESRADRGYELLKFYSDLIGWHKDFSQFEACDPIADIMHYVAQHEGEAEAVRQYTTALVHFDAEVHGE